MVFCSSSPPPANKKNKVKKGVNSEHDFWKKKFGKHPLQDHESKKQQKAWGWDVSDFKESKMCPSFKSASQRYISSSPTLSRGESHQLTKNAKGTSGGLQACCGCNYPPGNEFTSSHIPRSREVRNIIDEPKVPAFKGDTVIISVSLREGKDLESNWNNHFDSWILQLTFACTPNFGPEDHHRSGW